MTAPLLEVRRLTVATAAGRVLFRDLTLSLGAERVALIGRNGVGKTTLLETLAGQRLPLSGQVACRTSPYLVQQIQEPQAGLSPGQLRRQRLQAAWLAAPELLLLDEPTQDLDAEGVAWLRGRLSTWRGGLLVASHDVSLLRDFRHFFLVSESGCRYFSGSLEELERELEREQTAREAAYLRKLHSMVAKEEHADLVARRRARKKRYGRVREIDRATPRCTLNQKRDAAQDNHGRERREREARREAVRQWTLAGRRALKVELPLILPTPPVESAEMGDIVTLQFEHLCLSLKHQRVAVTGANGAGKTTLLETLLGQRRPDGGTVRSDPGRIGSIAQGGRDWMLAESLIQLLPGPEVLAAHQFPLALAGRPLRTLSPGERVRAALICLFQRSPAVELLVLDEPTYSLDLLGRKALTQALKSWRGGLVVASHDFDFLRGIAVDHWLEVNGTGLVREGRAG